MNTALKRFFSRHGRALLQVALALLPVIVFFAARMALADPTPEEPPSFPPAPLSPATIPTGGSLRTAASLGDVFCNIAGNFLPVGNMINWLGITAGFYFGLRGIMELKGHSENAQQHPLHRSMLYFLASTGLIALNSFIGALQGTFFSAQGPSGSLSCLGTAGIAPLAASGAGLDVMMQNMVSNINAPMTSMLSVLVYVIGVYLIVSGLMRASKHGTDPKTHSMTVIYTRLVIGAVMCAIASSLSTVLGTVFGTTDLTPSNSLLSWAAFSNNGVSQQFASAVQAALTFFQLVGLISFIRGWMILRQAVEGQGQSTVSQGLTHIIGGVIAANIYAFLPILDKTFGTGFTSS